MSTGELEPAASIILKIATKEVEVDLRSHTIFTSGIEVVDTWKEDVTSSEMAQAIDHMIYELSLIRESLRPQLKLVA